MDFQELFEKALNRGFQNPRTFKHPQRLYPLCVDTSETPVVLTLGTISSCDYKILPVEAYS